MRNGILKKGCTKSSPHLINGITLHNEQAIKRNCLICGDEFDTTVGGAHICPCKQCQKTLEMCSTIRLYRVCSPAREPRSFHLDKSIIY